MFYCIINTNLVVPWDGLDVYLLINRETWNSLCKAILSIDSWIMNL